LRPFSDRVDRVFALDAAVPKLLERNEVKTLWTLATALDAIATRPGARAGVATSALKRWNIEKLKAAARQPRFAKVDVDYGETIETAVG